MSEQDTERPPSPITLAPQADIPRKTIDEKIDEIAETLVILSDQMIGLTSAVNNNCADVREAIGTARLAGNQSRDVSERLDQTIAEFKAAVEILGAVKEASGSAIEMATKAIALGETATKLAAGTYNLTKQVATHLNLELVDEADGTPNLELLSSTRR